MSNIICHNVDNKQIVEVQILYNYGAMFEPIRKNGYAHLLEHLKIASNPFKDVWFANKTFTGVTAKEYIKMSYMITKDRLLESITLFKNTLLNLEISNQNVCEQKRQVINEIKSYNEKLSMLNVLSSIDNIFYNSGLGNCAGGDIDTVKNITDTELYDYNFKIFHDSPYILTCTGDLNEMGDIKQKIEDIYSDVPKTHKEFNFIFNSFKEVKILKVKCSGISEYILIYRLPGKGNDNFVQSKIVELIFKNVLLNYNLQIKLYPLYADSLLIVKINSEKSILVKEIIKKCDEKINEVIFESNILQAINELKIECLYGMTSLKTYADYLLESDCYNYSIMEILNNINPEEYIKKVRNTIKDMLQSGLLCKTITEDIMDEPYIFSWQFHLSNSDLIVK